MIKNYTSSVPACRSINHIEERLAAHGAQSVVKRYEGKRIAAVSFFMQIQGKLIPFMLPVKTPQVEKILRGYLKYPTSGRLEKLPEQAERTAWKIMSEWQEKTGQTFYQAVAERGFNLLEAPKK